MKLDIKQLSPEWFELKKTLLSATEYTNIIWECKHSKHRYNISRNIILIAKLLKQLTPFTPSIYTERGVALEPYIFTQVNKAMFNDELEASPCYKYGRLMASLDAINDCRKIIAEFKATMHRGQDLVIDYEYYRPQVIHQIMCRSEGKPNGWVGYLAQVEADEHTLANCEAGIPIPSDKIHITEIIPTEEELNQWHLETQKFLDDWDYAVKALPKANKIMEEIVAIKEHREQLEVYENELRQKLFSLNTPIAGDYEIRESVRKAVSIYDYKKIYQYVRHHPTVGEVSFTSIPIPDIEATVKRDLQHLQAQFEKKNKNKKDKEGEFDKMFFIEHREEKITKAIYKRKLD